MKLNELKHLNELDMNRMFGDYGSAAMKQATNKLQGGAGGQLSVKDRMAKDSFIRNFVGRAQTNLNSAIQSGLVDPRLKTAPAPAPAPAAPAAPAPAQIRQQKLAAAAKVANQSMIKGRPNPVTERYIRLNNLLENIINVEEADQVAAKQSISTYLQNMFSQYLKIPIRDPQAKSQLKVLADQAQASYPKMQDALTKLANLGFSISYSQGDAPAAAVGATGSQPSVGSSFMSGLTGKPSSEPASAAQPGTNTVDQIKKMIPTLNQQDLSSIKQMIDGALASRSNQSNVVPMNKKPSDTISAAKKGGATPEEYAKLQQRIAQATK
jgi:hypothetical protein